MLDYFRVIPHSHYCSMIMAVYHHHNSLKVMLHAICLGWVARFCSIVDSQRMVIPSFLIPRTPPFASFKATNTWDANWQAES